MGAPHVGMGDKERGMGEVVMGIYNTYNATILITLLPL